MTLIQFIRKFKKALRKHHRFDTPEVLRTWIPCEEGGYCGLDPICFMYWVKTGKVTNDWLRIAVKKFGLKKKVAWRLRYAADNRVPKSLDHHSKIQALRIRRRLIAIVKTMKRYYRENYEGKPFPYANIRTKRSARFATRRLSESSV